MLHFLSRVEPGFYFTLLSLVALQVVFELGFSFVIQQLAAHEYAHLTPGSDGTLLGDAIRHARLASILQLTVRWYGRAAIAVGVVLMPVGIYLFSHNERAGIQTQWFFPWLVSTTACVYLFVQNPLFSFLGGCGEVCQVAQMRFFQAEANNILVGAVMLTHHGLFAPAMVMAAPGTVGTLFLWGRRRFLLGLLRYPSVEHSVRWRVEIWPFQWRLAVCWLCTYFTMQIFTPMLFCYRNAAEAGQMGMSISVIGYTYAIVLAWMTTKAPPFGQFVARGEFADLDSLFFRTLRQPTFLLFLFVAASMLAVIALLNWSPALAARLVSPRVFGLLLLGTVGSVLIQCMAIYLRSFKREPFLWQSLAVALLTMLSSYLLVKRMGTPGILLSYFACTGVVGLLSATLIFQSWRNRSTKFQIQALPFVGNER